MSTIYRKESIMLVTMSSAELIESDVANDGFVDVGNVHRVEDVVVVDVVDVDVVVDVVDVVVVVDVVDVEGIAKFTFVLQKFSS